MPWVSQRTSGRSWLAKRTGLSGGVRAPEQHVASKTGEEQSLKSLPSLLSRSKLCARVITVSGKVYVIIFSI